MKFEFNTPSKIILGAGTLLRLPEFLRPGTALVIHNAHEETLSRVEKLLAGASVRTVILRQPGEPTVRDIDLAVERARTEDCTSVLGLGGGSAIDAAKAVAGLLTNGGTVLDYMEVVGKGQKITRPALPWVALPCTAGTGAEATRNAVIGYPEKQFKASVRSELLLPQVALIDPELALGVRPEVTARTGMDALCQCIEACTSAGAQPMIDVMALEGVRLAGRSLLAAYRDGRNLQARSEMALAALLSGIALTNAGLGAVHGFAAPMGASFPVPHGTVCAALLPGVMAANVAALRAADARHPGLGRYAAIGRALGASGNDEESIAHAIGVARTLCREMSIPRLGAFEVKESDIPALVGLAQKSSSMRYNPVKLSEQALGEILRGAL